MRPLPPLKAPIEIPGIVLKLCPKDIVEDFRTGNIVSAISEMRKNMDIIFHHLKHLDAQRQPFLQAVLSMLPDASSEAKCVRDMIDGTEAQRLVDPMPRGDAKYVRDMMDGTELRRLVGHMPSEKYLL